MGNLRLLPSLDVVAVSQAPSPESNPDSPLPVVTMDQPGKPNRATVGAKRNNRAALESYTRVSLREEGKSAFGDRGVRLAPVRRGGHLTKPSPQAPLGPPGYRTSRQDRPSEPPYEASAPGGAFSSHQSGQGDLASGHRTKLFAVP
ncbi:hypothetical protein G5714_024658 [Onychostoma macrolepis]|uniref:Uncharacterized protein n=1 Tax=Onychostoma macrolepis TaxID=369639 RepID=A0A7J6BH70_9TELE|nr:hypothetical protein G5714_024658 [Onychostoma macrolepis]